MISNVLEHAPRGKKGSDADILAEPGASAELEQEQLMWHGETPEHKRENTNKCIKNLLSSSIF